MDEVDIDSIVINDQIVPDNPTDDWTPVGYIQPDYDDPGSFDEREDGAA